MNILFHLLGGGNRFRTPSYWVNYTVFLGVFVNVPIILQRPQITKLIPSRRSQHCLPFCGGGHECTAAAAVENEVEPERLI